MAEVFTPTPTISIRNRKGFTKRRPTTPYKLLKLWAWLNRNWPGEREVNTAIYKYVKLHIWPYTNNGNVKQAWRCSESRTRRDIQKLRLLAKMWPEEDI